MIFPKTPIFIIKENQILITISPKDFSFVAESSIEKIFSLLVKERIKLNLMQNSALNFSIIIDNDQQKVKLLINNLKTEFTVLYNQNLSILTIRHYTDKAIEQLTNNSIIYLQQKSRNTVIYLIK